MAAKNLKKVNKERKVIEGGSLKTLWNRLGVGIVGVGAYSNYIYNPKNS